MTYDPSATSVKELILANILSTIEAIDTPAYSCKLLGRVQRTQGNVVQSSKLFPFVVIVEQGAEHSDRMTERVETFLRVAVMVGVSDAKTWRTSIQKILSDIKVALLSTPQRGSGPQGGYAVSTEVLDETVFDAPGPIGTGQLDIQVLYRTAYLDPTSPLN